MTGSAKPTTLPRYARAVTNYRRNFICGGSFFFTANLAERRLRLLVDDIVSAKDDGFRCRSTHPTR
jgi:putative transposase